MDKQDCKMGNCPHCTKVIFRDGNFNCEAAFTTRCPHCQKPLKVIVRKKIEIIIVPIEPRPEQKTSGKIAKGLIVLIMVIYLPPLIDLASNALDILNS